METFSDLRPSIQGHPIVTLPVFFNPGRRSFRVKNEEIMTFPCKKVPVQTYLISKNENPVSLSQRARNSNIVFHFSPLMQLRFD